MISRALVKFLRALTSCCRPHPLLTGKRRDSSDRWWLVSPCWNKRCQRSSSHRWQAGWESYQARPQIWKSNYKAKYSLGFYWLGFRETADVTLKRIVWMRVIGRNEWCAFDAFYHASPGCIFTYLNQDNWITNVLLSKYHEYIDRLLFGNVYQIDESINASFHLKRRLSSGKRWGKKLWALSFLLCKCGRTSDKTCSLKSMALQMPS